MPFTMKQLTKRYGAIVVDLDKDAPSEAKRKELLGRIGVINAELAQLAVAIEDVAKQLRAETLAVVTPLGNLDDGIRKLLTERFSIRRRLDRRAVRFVSGRRGPAKGIVVGEGDTQAAALADAARRVGKA